MMVIYVIAVTQQRIFCGALCGGTVILLTLWCYCPKKVV